jgi:hypothetical protein
LNRLLHHQEAKPSYSVWKLLVLANKQQGENRESNLYSVVFKLTAIEFNTSVRECTGSIVN